jgi:hypothetical protein
MVGEVKQLHLDSMSEKANLPSFAPSDEYLLNKARRCCLVPHGGLYC